MLVIFMGVIRVIMTFVGVLGIRWVSASESTDACPVISFVSVVSVGVNAGAFQCLFTVRSLLGDVGHGSISARAGLPVSLRLDSKDATGLLPLYFTRLAAGGSNLRGPGRQAEDD